MLPVVASGRGILMSAGKHAGFCGRIPGMFYTPSKNFCGCLEFGCFCHLPTRREAYFVALQLHSCWEIEVGICMLLKSLF